jgi:hypothetical protein
VELSFHSKKEETGGAQLIKKKSILIFKFSNKSREKEIFKRINTPPPPKHQPRRRLL